MLALIASKFHLGMWRSARTPLEMQSLENNCIIFQQYPECSWKVDTELCYMILLGKDPGSPESSCPMTNHYSILKQKYYCMEQILYAPHLIIGHSRPLLACLEIRTEKLCHLSSAAKPFHWEILYPDKKFHL